MNASLYRGVYGIIVNHSAGITRKRDVDVAETLMETYLDRVRAV